MWDTPNVLKVMIGREKKKQYNIHASANLHIRILTITLSEALVESLSVVHTN